MLSENIKKLRQEKGLTQEELAVRLNVVRQTVSKWEQGLSVPDSELLIKIAEVFEVTVGSLLDETPSKTEELSDLKQIAFKLEQLNVLLAERNARNRKLMKWIGITLCVLASVFFGLFVLIPMLVILYYSSASASVGIIGGADGPTAMFVTTAINWPQVIIITLIAVMVIIASIVLIKKSKR